MPLFVQLTIAGCVLLHIPYKLRIRVKDLGAINQGSSFKDVCDGPELGCQFRFVSLEVIQRGAKMKCLGPKHGSSGRDELDSFLELSDSDGKGACITCKPMGLRQCLVTCLETLIQ